MALDRRTLRDLLARPLIDEDARRTTLVFVAAGEQSRHALHSVGVSVEGAQRRAQDHVIVLPPRGGLVVSGRADLETEIHLVGIAADEAEHPVTKQLASRAQGVICAPDHPRALRSLPHETAGDDVVAAYRALLTRVFKRIDEEHGLRPSSPTPGAELDDDAPPSVGTRRCELALLGVGGVTAQELLTALDRIMEKSRYRRCAHAGGGRDFTLMRGRAGAGLRVVDDRAGSATDLAVQLASSLEQEILVATAVGEQEIDTGSGHIKTKMSWTLESVTATGTGVALRDWTTISEASPQWPLDERVARHIADDVFSIQPEPDGIAIHYERV
jgi:hypothetical protein